ncbi:LIM domain-containing protein HDR3 isoform X2 [Physcomitrium patens]|uniref:LIM domain-containing protein HDR3 isoform X2 n=1 Tax=Physcomitrium patens TaxID=3218 RepID=UPI000D15C1E6|nr:protein DA1-related 1-like isoform X2 [Physcomitrium patens]|eukprot:XP_024399365.1 protein DA1-related 1-like isoform X2 [Physcomitrella patens]
MGWFDKLLGNDFGSSYRYGEGDEYPRLQYAPRQSSGGWHGPNIFDDGMRNGAGTSYSNDRHGYDRQGYDRQGYDRQGYDTHYDSRLPFHDSSSNDRHEPSLEETDRAIALALAEEEEQSSRGARPVYNLDEDEQLAKALQDSVDFGHRDPWRVPDYTPSYPPPPARSSGLTVCAGCGESLGYGRFLSCLGRNWHPDCFCCKKCGTAIADREFSVNASEAYHRECYKELYHPKCEVCEQFIPTNSVGLIEYRSHPFWNQKYCPRHERDGTPRCCSCDRIEAGGPGTYISLAQITGAQGTLADDRKVCLECFDTIVVDTAACQPLYREIMKYYDSIGMPIEQEIPMLLVARSALNAARDVEKDGHTHSAETRGLCLSEEQTITSVHGGGKSRTPTRHMRAENQKLTRHCEVTAILVLYGLPRLLTGSILAHELMHAWLRLQVPNFPHMRPEVEEGICQVMSHIWLTTELKKLKSGRSSSSSSSSQTAIETRLAEFYLHQIASDSSPVYGDGFRYGIAAVQQFGLSRVLEHLRLTANFPL